MIRERRAGPRPVASAARALRSMTSRACCTPRASTCPAQDPRPAEHGVQRRAELVRERGEELVLQPVGRLRLLASVAHGEEQVAHLVLPPPRSQRGLDRAEDRGRVQRPAEAASRCRACPAGEWCARGCWLRRTRRTAGWGCRPGWLNLERLGEEGQVRVASSASSVSRIARARRPAPGRGTRSCPDGAGRDARASRRRRAPSLPMRAEIERPAAGGRSQLGPTSATPRR